MKRLLVKTSIGAAGLASLLLLPLGGCTNLDESPASVITPGNFFRTDAEVLAGLAGVYAQLRATTPEGGIYDAIEVSTDEIVVPTRGQDWYDNGQWIDLHNQTWTPTSAATGNFFNGVWNSAYTGVARANLFLSAIQNATVSNKAAIIGEARALRAFYYYLLMDFFGGVPIVTTPAVSQNPRNTRHEVFNFIEKELMAARDSGLPATWPASSNGRLTKGAADAILANMYINAGVFTKESAAGGISANSYNTCLGVTVSGGDACAMAIAAVDRIINSGYYLLADSFPQNFRAGNSASKENIFSVKFIAADGLGLYIIMSGLHYNQFNPTPWNGFATLAQTYNSFDSAGVGGAAMTDKRRRAILIGRQANVLTGQLVNDRAGNPLIFTDTIHDIHQATEGEGPRPYKWPADPAHIAQNNGNDFAWFRLGEMYLIKAEALNEQTPGSATALGLLNTLRHRTDSVNTTLAGPITRAMILRERLFELFVEAKRRQDLIRFGGYTGRVDDPSLAGGKQARPAYYVLMPIPQTQLDANPKLTQNPGY